MYITFKNDSFKLVYFDYFLVLRKAFDAFDRERSGSIPTDMVADILRLMGQPFNKKILDELIEEVDADSNLYFYIKFYVHINVMLKFNRIWTFGV